MSESWYLLQSGFCAPAENMAWDEALLEAVARLGQPVLRFYGWSEAAATFGYAQRYTDVAGWSALRPLIRRPTGGGLVPHDCDWTYSLVFPPRHPWYQLKATESYRRVHEWIREAFSKVSVQTELSADCRNEGMGRCFLGAEPSDVLMNGSKVAGAAQRRNRFGLLIQGSVQAAATKVERLDWEHAMVETVPGWSHVIWQKFAVDDRVADRVRELEGFKYSRSEFNQRR